MIPICLDVDVRFVRLLHAGGSESPVGLALRKPSGCVGRLVSQARWALACGHSAAAYRLLHVDVADLQCPYLVHD